MGFKGLFIRLPYKTFLGRVTCTCFSKYHISPLAQLENELDELRNRNKEQHHQQQKQQQAMDELALRLISLENERSTNAGVEQYGDDTVGVAAGVDKGAGMLSQPALQKKKKKKKGKKKKKEEVVFQLHCEYREEATINFHDHSVKFHSAEGFATIIAPEAIVPPHAKVWYEVEFTTDGGCGVVGWTSNTNMPFCQKILSQTEDECIVSVDHSYGFCPFLPYKRHSVGTSKFGKVLVDWKGYVGVALDLVQGEVLFSVEGQWTSPMGVAFSDIPTDQKFFPVITGDSETLKFNFGDRPCKFGPPDPTFKNLIDVL